MSCICLWKKIILIIGGGIAAYKSLDLIRMLKKYECDVKVILTKSGKKFVTPLSIAALSQNKVYQDIFDSENEAEMDHISLSRWADVVLFAPATANKIARVPYKKGASLAKFTVNSAKAFKSVFIIFSPLKLDLSLKKES